MYNTEQKENFISEYTTHIETRKAAVAMFNALEPHEVSWGADVCTRSAEELQPVVDELVGLRTDSKRHRLSMLRAYVKWCIAQGVPNACEGVLQIEEIGLEKIKRQMVANPQHLQMYLDGICDKEAEQTVDCVYRCFFWLAYGGMKESDVLSVVESDVDLDAMVVRYGGREYPIYREALSAFKNCVTLKQFRYKHPNYGDDKIVFRDRALGNILLRGMSATPSITAIRVEMARKSRISDNLKLTFFRVGLSGLFYRTYEAERAGMPVDFMAAAADFMDGKTYNLERGRNLIGAKQRRVAKGYMTDYSRWKEAYSI